MKRIYLPIAIATALGAGINTPAIAQTCSNADVANAQQNTATQADLKMMEQAGSFIFGTVAEVAGAGTVENVFSTALGLGTSDASADVVGAELQCQQAEIQAINGELSQLQTQLTTLAGDVARDHNNNLRNTVAQDYSRLAVDVAWLYPPSMTNPVFRNIVSSASVKRGTNGAPPPAPSSSSPGSSPQVTLQIAHAAAVDAQGVADLYRTEFLSRWQAEDVSSNGTMAANFEPYPALHVYLMALQVWMTAIQFEEADEGSQGFATIKQEYGADLAKHLAFLKSRAAGGQGASNVQSDPTYNPLPDQIASQISCTWQAAAQYPQGNNHQCTATPSCLDNIQKKTWNATNAQSGWNGSQSYSFTVASAGTMCSFDPRNLPAVDMQAKLYSRYGMDTITQVQSMVDTLTRTGSMFARQPVSGSFGGSSGANSQSVFIYSVNTAGTVFRSQTSGTQVGAAQQVATGWNNLRFLLPGGGNVFYTVNSNGALNWYNFQSTTAAVTGPVQLATTFGNYTTVFGGSDGVIYAIGQDGSLTWYRNTNVNSGGGPAALTGPKPVGTGWAQYRSVFSAGSGVIYAVQADGTLLWFHHKDYLTGISMDPAGTTGPSRVQKQPLPYAHWDGPLKVGSGWAGFRTVQAGGGGVVLAVKADGTLLWYKQDDYLTGGSTTTSTSPQVAATTGFGRVPTTAVVSQTTAAAQPAPNWGATAAQPNGQPQWGSPTGATGLKQGFAAPSAMGAAPASAFGARSLGGTTMAAGSGTTPQVTSALNRSGAPGLQNTSLPTGPQGPGGIQGAQNSNVTATVVAQPHWEGPTTIGSGWQQYPLISAVLPGTVQAVIK